MRDAEPAHLLIVPPTGILEIVHADHGIDVAATLRQRAEGVLVNLDYKGLTAHWLGDEAGQLNPRARRAWIDLTGVEIVFTGPVIFTGIDTHTIVRLVDEVT